MYVVHILWSLARYKPIMSTFHRFPSGLVNWWPLHYIWIIETLLNLFPTTQLT